MIAFTTAVIDPEAYRRYARPGIERAAEPGASIQVYEAVGSLGRSANLLLDAAARLDDLEALVIVDQTVEITDGALCTKVRHALADPAVAVAGCAGATAVSGIAWWDGVASSGPVTLRYPEHGGGELEAFAFARPAPAPREVDAVGGFLLALSPWAVRNVRFDERLHLGLGYDVDYCRQVREAGRKVVTAPLEVTWHRSLDLVSEQAMWVEAHIAVARRDGDDDADWKARARRAEAERDAARTLAYSNRLQIDARTLELEAALRVATSSRSWRLTAPLRRLNALRRSVVERRADLVLGDDRGARRDAGAAPQPGQPLGDRERARLQ
jgi:hypothetical protein